MTNHYTLKEYEAHKEPLPSYDEYKRLQEQLAIATKALEEYAKTETNDWIDSQVKAKRALKEMEGVK